MTRNTRPFASRMQTALIVLLLLSLLLIAQQGSITLYHLGLILLVGTTFVQIGFGNIPPTASFGRSMRLLLLSLIILAIVFGVGILLAPYLVNLGRG
jgi:hypothetical protein